MVNFNKINRVVGFDAEAYSQRQKGHSPEPIRDAVWKLIGHDLEGNVLDAGSGEGGWIKKLKENKQIKRIIGVDIVDDGAGKIDGVEFHTTDLSRFPLPCSDNELDFAFALEVLEHLANPRNFINEASRCLKKGGKLIITTPCNDSLRARLSLLFRGYFPAFCDRDYCGSGHITPILELDLKRMISEANFESINFFYPLAGQIPTTSIKWQKVFPRLQGKAWSDCLFAIAVK